MTDLIKNCRTDKTLPDPLLELNSSISFVSLNIYYIHYETRKTFVIPCIKGQEFSSRLLDFCEVSFINEYNTTSTIFVETLILRLKSINLYIIICGH